jgi:hypothetical protein
MLIHLEILILIDSSIVAVELKLNIYVVWPPFILN